MFSWIFIIIVAYFFLSLSAFGDKLILKGSVYPKLYVFYVGFLGGFIAFLIPFIHFSLPSLQAFLWIFIEAVTFILGLYFMYSAVESFDASRVAPVIGAFQPLIILSLSWIFFDALIGGKDILAFVVLILGTIIISFESKLKISKKFLKLTLLAALMFALEFISLKLVFGHQSFLEGLIWTRIVICAIVLFFLLDKKIRKEIFEKRNIFNKATGTLFLFSQSMGGLAIFLQNFAISLAPISYLAIMNALRGLQYVFLFIITLFFSIFLPKILREETSKKAIFRKVSGLLLIIIGLFILLF